MKFYFAVVEKNHLTRLDRSICSFIAPACKIQQSWDTDTTCFKGRTRRAHEAADTGCDLTTRRPWPATPLDLLLSSCSCQLQSGWQTRRDANCWVAASWMLEQPFSSFSFSIKKKHAPLVYKHCCVLRICDPHGRPEEKVTQNGQHEVTFHSVFFF